MNLGKLGDNFIVEQGATVVKSLIGKAPKTIPPLNSAEYASKLTADTVQFTHNVGKHKIPRYLYHFTTAENYEKILKTGKIVSSSDETLGNNAVFMVELDNLMKNWCTDLQIGKKTFPLINGLMSQIGHTSAKKQIVLLRIPSSHINHNKLAIRSQKTYFRMKPDCGEEFTSFYESSEVTPLYEKIRDYLIKKYSTANNKSALEYVESDAVSIADSIIEKRFLGKYRYKDYKGKIPATQSNLFKQRKEPIEYIYYEDIPLDSIEVVGSSNFSFDKYPNLESIYKFLEKIFGTQPEANALKNFKLPKTE